MPGIVFKGNSKEIREQLRHLAKVYGKTAPMTYVIQAELQYRTYLEGIEDPRD